MELNFCLFHSFRGIPHEQKKRVFVNRLFRRKQKYQIIFKSPGPPFARGIKARSFAPYNSSDFRENRYTPLGFRFIRCSAKTRTAAVVYEQCFPFLTVHLNRRIFVVDRDIFTVRLDRPLLSMASVIKVTRIF